ncbi:MAG: hypothetical protein ACRCT7_08985 [Shewanella sp.]|uniref:hypothetical protein n=1 Tax=Shewanella sp. SNU WT4 TaxID=2590015 RepID=UPI00112CD87F|nr:hypothetical protein [Shewanella sp. SNU WT4]QDF68084.1 hypothetical protein FJQ87_16685 [Shewanella sp. SNU WT4]
MNKEKIGLIILAIVAIGFGIYAIDGSRQVLAQFGINSPWPVIGVFSGLIALTWCANRWFWPTLVAAALIPLGIIVFG